MNNGKLNEDAYLLVIISQWYLKAFIHMYGIYAYIYAYYVFMHTFKENEQIEN